MYRISRVLALAAMLAPATVGAQDRVYRWTDAQGVVHYSQVPPEKVRAEARDIRSHEPALPAPAPEPTPAERACGIAQANRALLDSNKALTLDKDGDGKPEPMNAEERAAAKELNARQIAAFCRPAPTPAPASTTSPPDDE